MTDGARHTTDPVQPDESLSGEKAERNGSGLPGSGSANGRPSIMQPRPVPRQSPSSPGSSPGKPDRGGTSPAETFSSAPVLPNPLSGSKPPAVPPVMPPDSSSSAPSTPGTRPAPSVVQPTPPSAAETISNRLAAARQAVKEKAASMKEAAVQASENRAKERELRAAERRAAERKAAVEAAELHASQSGSGYGSGMSHSGGPSGPRRPGALGPAAAGLPGVPAVSGTTPAPAGTSTAHYTAPGGPRTTPPARPGTAARTSTGHRTRKARLRLSRVDPWSMMKTAFLLAIAFGIVTWVAVFVVWSAIGAAGVFDNINRTVQEVLGTPGADPFRIQDYVSTNKVMGFTTLLACADVLILTALATLGAFLYNIAATLLGGLEITLASED